MADIEPNTKTLLIDGSPSKYESLPEFGMGMVVNDVRAFMQACGQDTPGLPALPDDAVRDLRIRLHDEEVNKELRGALERGDLTEIADGVADGVFVMLGTALAYGIPLAKVWARVCEANMAKVDPVTGMVFRRADGKIIKPEGWVPPDIAGLIRDALHAGQGELEL